jgi:hypothetical protein
MDSNEVDPKPAEVALGATTFEPSPPTTGLIHGLLRSSWRGAKTGFRCTSYVIGPVAGLFFLAGLVICAFAAGTGRGLPLVPSYAGPFFGYGPFWIGWGLPPILLRPIQLYLGFAACGAIFGAGVGFAAALIRWCTRGTRTPAWWAAAHRPIRLFCRKPRAVTPAGIAPARRRRRLWPWLVGVSLFQVLAVAFGTGVYLGRMVDRRLAAAIAAADRDDPYWRLDDLMAHREPVPDAENSALVVAEALAHLPENWPRGPAPQPGAPRPPATEVEQAFDRLETADNVRLDDAVADTLRTELHTYQEAVWLAWTAADYPRGRHALQLGPTLLDTPLPETQAARGAARLLSADAAIRAHDGDLDGALDSCGAILGVARSIGDEPFTISQLARIAMGMVALNSTQHVLGQGEPSDGALERVQTLVLDERTYPLQLYALRGERAVTVELIRRIGAGELPIAALSEGAAALEPARPRIIISGGGRLWFDNQRAVALEWMNEAVDIARRPAAAQAPLWDAWQANLDRLRKSWYGPYIATLPMLLLPALNASGTAHARYQGALGAMAVLLAAERHRRRMGDWPASIATIDPDLLPDPPVDPFSSQAFRMERRDGQFVVYSIGPNRKDEHGAFDRRRHMDGGLDDVVAAAWDVALRAQTSETPRKSAPGE